MLTPKSQASLLRGGSINFVLMNNNSLITGKHGGWGSAQHNKRRAKLLRLSRLEDQKNDAEYMKEVDNFISGCDIPP